MLTHALTQSYARVVTVAMNSKKRSMSSLCHIPTIVPLTKHDNDILCKATRANSPHLFTFYSMRTLHGRRYYPRQHTVAVRFMFN